MTTEEPITCPECSALVADLEHHRQWHLWLRRRRRPYPPNPEHPEYQDPLWAAP